MVGTLRSELIPDAHSTCHLGELLAVTLTVPEPWAEIIAAASATLSAEFSGLPQVQFAPHISLCQPFRPAATLSSEPAAEPSAAAGTVAAIAGVIERMLSGQPAPIIRTGDVSCFEARGGGSEVVYIPAESEWLRRVNRRLVFETGPFHAACPHPAGNGTFDLSGYTPHITLAITRELPADPHLHAAIAARAAALWSKTSPRWESFHATDVVLSVTTDDHSGGVLPAACTLRRWKLAAAAPLANRDARQAGRGQQLPAFTARAGA